MGTHRVDELAARNQPVPRTPLTNDRPRPNASGESPPRKRVRRPPQSLWRRLVGVVRSKRGRWVLVGFICIAALILGMLAEGFFSSPAPAVSMPNGLGNSDVTTPPASPLASKPPKHHGGGKGKNGLVTNPVQQLRNALPDNPLNNLRGTGVHHVTLKTTTPLGKIPVLGFLVPTGMGSAYGSLNGQRSPWTYSEQALGPGYLAAIFIQTGATGLPITCTVSVDGKVTSRETASGAYGRAVCLG